MRTGRLKRKTDKLNRWINNALAKPAFKKAKSTFKMAIVAFSNKDVRITWVLFMKGESDKCFNDIHKTLEVARLQQLSEAPEHRWTM